jgi:dipeptidyl aminopeptidase/acylaminoacyl peptidase
MTPEEYLDALLNLPKLYVPRVSRDGKKVAWTWAQVGPVADVFFAPTDGSTAPIQLSSTKQDTWLVSWSPDSDSVIVAQDRDGNERYQLFQINLSQPGEMKPLTKANPNFFLRGGQLHPNGQWLVYAANFDADRREEIETTWLYRQDLNTGKMIPLAKPQKAAYYTPQLNQQGSHILYSRKDLHPAGRQVWLVDINGQEDCEILNFGAEVKTTASWFPNGERAVVLTEVDHYRKLGVWNRKNEVLVWLVDDPERNIEAAFVPPNGDRIVLIEIKEARIHSSLLNPDTGEEIQLPRLPFNLIPIAPMEDGEWIAQIYSSKQPYDIARMRFYEPMLDSLLSITRVWERTRLKSDDLFPAEDFRWTAKDGLEIQGWLYRTPHRAHGTIVTVHGGPTYHSEDRVDTQVQFLVSQGFNVLDPNYRGSTGFDLSFQEAIKEDGWGGKEQDDIIAGIDKMLSLGIAKDYKVGITGASYGGYSAWCAITRNPLEVVSAAAPVCGMTDLVVDYETTRPDLRPYSEEMIGGSPEEVPEKYYERSPIHFVENIHGKVLIVQGLQDPNVSPENVKEVQRALEKAGVSYELLAFKDEGHGVFRPKNLKTLYLRLVEFFKSSFSS